MAKAERHNVARGQASIVPPLSSRLVCRLLWRGQLPPHTFRLVESNTLVRLPSCVLRSLDAFHECFGFGLTQCRRPTWVARRVWRADFRLQPRPALEGGPLRLTHKRTDQEHRQARGEAPGGLVRGFSGSVGGTSDGRDYTVTVRLGMQPKAENNPGVTTSHSSAIFCLIEWRAGRNQPPSCGKLRRQLTAPGLLPCGKSSFLFGGADAVSSSKR